MIGAVHSGAFLVPNTAVASSVKVWGEMRCLEPFPTGAPHSSPDCSACLFMCGRSGRRHSKRSVKGRACTDLANCRNALQHLLFMAICLMQRSLVQLHLSAHTCKVFNPHLQHVGTTPKVQLRYLKEVVLAFFCSPRGSVCGHAVSVAGYVLISTPMHKLCNQERVRDVFYTAFQIQTLEKLS